MPLDPTSDQKTDQKALPDYETWHQVLKRVLISPDAVSPAHLERYADMRLCGTTYWGAVYAADVKMRREHFERLRPKWGEWRGGPHLG
eukprot:5502952-Amphidinium_carterae.2